MEVENDKKVTKDFTRVGYALVLCLVASYIWDIFYFAMVLIIFVQMLLSLLNDEPNQQVTNFTRSLGKVISGGFSYVFFLTDDKPFPFSPWPASSNTEDPAVDLSQDEQMPDEVTQSPQSEGVGEDVDQKEEVDTEPSGDSGDSDSKAD